MLKRVIEGFKYMFGGEIELPENVQKAIKMFWMKPLERLRLIKNNITAR